MNRKGSADEGIIKGKRGEKMNVMSE